MALRSPIVHFPIRVEKSSDSNCNRQEQTLKCTQIANFKDFTFGRLVKPPINLSKLPSFKGQFLGAGYTKANSISVERIKNHNQSIVNQLLHFLHDQSLLADNNNNNLQTFVFLGVEGATILSDLLGTWLCPRISKGWKFYGIRHQDFIYLWREPEVNSDSPESYYHQFFQALINNHKSTDLTLENTEFVVNRQQFGTHQIFVAVKVDAVNELKEMLGVRLHKEFSPISIRQKRLSYWTEWIASGWNGLIVGQRDYRGLLQGVEIFNNENKEQLLHQSKISGGECLQRQDAFLHWMKDQLDRNQGIVHQFSWSPSDWIFADRVTCSEGIEQVPPWWYVSLKKQQNHTVR